VDRGGTAPTLLTSALAVAGFYLGGRAGVSRVRAHYHARELLFGLERWLVVATFGTMTAILDPAGVPRLVAATLLVSYGMIAFVPHPLFVTRRALVAWREALRRRESQGLLP